ncbi:TPA: GTP-binding protein, partial [Campylobacter coli]|nr:GTP-binding protein [Campylobacter coli]
MKIINLGILAHVDAGKTTLTESLLYTSGAIAELGSVDEGTTRTDTMNLERQRGITIQTAVTSFQWEDVKVNIIDTPGHMDFLAEVYRSLSVLDGAVLLVSAKDGIQAQTRILFHALQIMKIPTIFFINKIDQEGIDLPMVYREMKAKLSSEIIVKQKVGQHPHINVTDNDDMEQWDAVIMGNDELLEKYMSWKPFKMSELEQEENRRFQNGTLFPVYHGSAKNNLGIRQLIEVIASKFYSSTPEGQSELCGQVFKIEYSEERQRLAYVRLYGGILHLRDSVRISEKEKIKITEMYTSINGELCKIDKAYSGEIVILQNEFLKLNSVLGDTKLLPQRERIENPLPMLQTTVEPSKPQQREMLLDALLEISDSDPLLQYYVDTTTHEIILSFLGNVQMEVICAILEEKYHVEAEIKEPTVIYMERPLRKAEYTIHIEVPPNPFWASVGVVVKMPLPPGRARAFEAARFEAARKQGCACVAWSRKRRSGFISRQGVYESPRPSSYAPT